MSTLIIHAGTHKTATTLIQETLGHNRSRLKAGGLVYPTIGHAAGHHLLASEWLSHLAPYHDDRPAAEHWQRLLARHAGGTATVLLSSEEFSRGGPERVDMAALGTYAAAFGTRRIVFVLRNQLAYIQSLYLEMQRQFRLPAVHTYVKQCLKGGHASGMFLDYGALYDHALTVFRPEEVRLLSYEALAAAGPDMTTAFLDALGLRPPGVALEPLPADRGNVSPDPLSAWAANRVSAPRIAQPELVALATEAFTEEFGEGARSTLFTAGEAAAIRECFEPANRALEARYRAVDPTFAMAPVALRDGLVQRDRIPETFWLRIARRLHAVDAGRWSAEA